MDSTDFLTKVPTTVPNETLLATFDVVSLCTNIPHDLGLTAVKYWLDKYPDSINQRFLCKFILEATKFILETIRFNSITNITSKSQERLWAPKWHLHMQH